MIRVIDIAQIVCLSLDVDVADVMTHRRQARTVDARQITMYLAKEVLDLSYSEIGRQLGEMHHQTIKYGIEKIEAEIRADARLKDLIGSLKETLEYRTTLESLGGIDPLAAARRIVLQPRRGALQSSTYELSALAVFALDLWEVASCAESLAHSIMAVDPPGQSNPELTRMRAFGAAIIDEMNHIAGAPVQAEPALPQGEEV